MYYIINQNNEIIAADLALLALLHAKDVSELYKKVILGEITFELKGSDELLLNINGEDEHYKVGQAQLSSILGELSIVHIMEPFPLPKNEDIKPDISELVLNSHDIDDNILTENIPEETSSKNENEMFELLDLNSQNIDQQEEIEEETEEIAEETVLQEEEIDLNKLFDEVEEKTEALPSFPTEIDIQDEIHEDMSEKEALYELVLPTETSETIDTIDSDKEKTVKEEQIENSKTIENDTSPIIIDIISVSEAIGITPEDYNTFLNEYIDTAIHLEKDLQSDNQKTKASAIQTLSHLSNVLHLPQINTIMDTLATTEDVKSQEEYIAALYSTLSRLTTYQHTSPTESQKVELDHEETIPVTEDHLDIEPIASQPSDSEIDLSKVQPVHFDFQLEEAANDLSLPVELIEEFVFDFIEQAKVETPKMIEAYKKGDLDTAQKIGHLLKGAASNLRITPLADTLYEIQFCENINKLKPLIKNYWAHFLSFEQQMNIISK